MLIRLRKWNKKAQSTAEYAVLFALVVGAVVAMQVYVRRGIQGRLKSVVDDITIGNSITNVAGLGTIFANGQFQYEPYYLASDARTERESNQVELMGTNGMTGRTLVEATGSGREQIMGWGNELANVATGPSANIGNIAAPNMVTINTETGF